MPARLPNRNRAPGGRRRVALFFGNYDCVRDGADQALNRLVAHLERAGPEVRVYSPAAAEPAFAPAGDLRGVPSIPIPGRPDYRLARPLPARTRRELEAFAPTLVHLSAPDPLGMSAKRWARARRGPVAASLHTRFETPETVAAGLAITCQTIHSHA